MIKFVSDFEIAFVIILLLVLFCFGLTLRESKQIVRCGLDKNYSSVLKALGCVFVLIDHYEANVHMNVGDNSKFGGLIYCTIANVANGHWYK